MKGPESREELPVLGAEEVVSEEGVIDTVYRSINEFELRNQEGEVITAATVKGKIYVVDFFFTSCPTICPKMTKQMHRVYQEFEGNENVLFLSHTIDTRHDSIPVLKAYAEKLEVSSNQWHFLYGERDPVYDLAEQYMVSAMEDETAPGGYIHSGAFILMDGEHRIRGYYDGVLPEDVDQLMLDIETLLASYEK
jgi:protein SCO1/2